MRRTAMVFSLALTAPLVLGACSELEVKTVPDTYQSGQVPQSAQSRPAEEQEPQSSAEVGPVVTDPEILVAPETALDTFVQDPTADNALLAFALLSPGESEAWYRGTAEAICTDLEAMDTGDPDRFSEELGIRIQMLSEAQEGVEGVVPAPTLYYLASALACPQYTDATRAHFEQ